MEEIQEIKFETQNLNIKSNDGLKFLGELLGELRKNKAMSTLMICRQIKSVTIEEKIAVLDSDTDLSELLENERHIVELRTFFESRGLGFKLKQKNNTETDIEKLNRLLGGRLVIKE